jgi:translation initiation factor 2 beta subunit (eIF-2beta)/eIF-5
MIRMYLPIQQLANGKYIICTQLKNKYFISDKIADKEMRRIARLTNQPIKRFKVAEFCPKNPQYRDDDKEIITSMILRSKLNTIEERYGEERKKLNDDIRRVINTLQFIRQHLDQKSTYDDKGRLVTAIHALKKCVKR